MIVLIFFALCGSRSACSASVRLLGFGFKSPLFIAAFLALLLAVLWAIRLYLLYLIFYD
jgi:hypothetical protein